MRVVAELEMETHTLAEVLANHLPPGQDIDFLSVDVEGFDHKVLKSNDWTKYRPSIVLAEDLPCQVVNQPGKSTMEAFMQEKGYVLTCKTLHTVFFINEEQLTVNAIGIGLKEPSRV